MSHKTSFALCLLALVAAAASGAALPGSEDPYRILITNDDGIDSPGVAALVDVLGEGADVVVVAPDGNRSGSSHATMPFDEVMRVAPFRREGRLLGYEVSGMPADATRFGLTHVGRDEPFDLVVSGINQGENVGLLAHLSGTVGAAKEALLSGVPAIAVSQSRRRGDDYLTAARFTAQVVERVRARGLPPGVMLSINVPGGDLVGAAAARMAGYEFDVKGYVEDGTDGEATLYRLDLGFQWPREGGDTRSFANGYVTVTPIRLDMTDYRTLGELADWDLALR
ncbi:MAG: 5'/3'-nucleotidase SurE [Acidobacteriota bacterium]